MKRLALLLVLAAVSAACADGEACVPPDPDFAAWAGAWEGTGQLLGGAAPCPLDVAVGIGNAAGGLPGDPACDRVFLQVTGTFTGATCSVPITPASFAWLGVPDLTATSWTVPVDLGTLTLTRDGDALAGAIPGVLEFTATRVPAP